MTTEIPKYYTAIFADPTEDGATDIGYRLRKGAPDMDAAAAEFYDDLSRLLSALRAADIDPVERARFIVKRLLPTARLGLGGSDPRPSLAAKELQGHKRELPLRRSSVPKLMARRIFVSLPANSHLTGGENRLKWAIVERIEKLGYTVEIFTDPRGRDSLAASRRWTADAVDEIVRRCQGAVLIGLPRWTFEDGGVCVLLPTEFSYYEGALARALGIPILIIVRTDILRRVVFDRDFSDYLIQIPADAGEVCLDSDEFRVTFDYWAKAVDDRKDIFIGYCSKSVRTADKIKTFLTSQGASVLDWMEDFDPAQTIMQQIEQARRRCTAGIFLFTNDDVLEEPSGTSSAAPRDNVVFEAGYFSSAKGKQRVLIILEKGAKLPADLGGDIYASLEDRSNIAPIEDTLTKFLKGI